MKTNIHYRKKYFDWQKQYGEFGGIANKYKFEKYISLNNTVLDFGCGGGYLLDNILCKKKLGIEINPVATKIARSKGIIVYTTPSQIPRSTIDVIISNHALEHVDNPLDIVTKLSKALKPGGLCIFVVPHEGWQSKYKPNNMSQHLYTWSPMDLGNLFSRAGLEVIDAKSLFYRWPPFFGLIYRYFGYAVFDLLSKLYGYLFRGLCQTIVVAKKA